jgi:hypothetical protein
MAKNYDSAPAYDNAPASGRSGSPVAMLMEVFQELTMAVTLKRKHESLSSCKKQKEKMTTRSMAAAAAAATTDLNDQSTVRPELTTSILPTKDIKNIRSYGKAQGSAMFFAFSVNGTVLAKVVTNERVTVNQVLRLVRLRGIHFLPHLCFGMPQLPQYPSTPLSKDCLLSTSFRKMTRKSRDLPYELY